MQRAENGCVCVKDTVTIIKLNLGLLPCIISRLSGFVHTVKYCFQDFPGLAKTKFQGFPGLTKLVFKDVPGYIHFTNMAA